MMFAGWRTPGLVKSIFPSDIALNGLVFSYKKPKCSCTNHVGFVPHHNTNILSFPQDAEETGEDYRDGAACERFL
jgi:hypothetical protein